MELSSQMVLFARVVEGGSLSAAARAVGHSPSAVSKQISQLEARFGVRLLRRAVGGVHLTEEGRAFYERCAVVAASVQEVEALAAGFGEAPQGRLRIASTVAFGKTQLLPILGEFMDRWPEVRVSLELTDRRVDLSEEDVDLCVRFTEQIGDDRVVARKLARNRRVLCAAPAYLERAGAPRTLAGLRDHECLRLSAVAEWNDWRVTDEAGAAVRPDGRFEANSADAIYHAALAGLGIARLSTYLIGPDLASGRLVRVLPDYAQEDSDIVALFPSRRNLPLRTRAFIDWLAGRFTPRPPWEAPGREPVTSAAAVA